MPSQSAKILMQRATVMAANLYRITITDAWIRDQGGNIEVASQESQRHSMNAVLQGIRGIGRARGAGAGILRKRHIPQPDPEVWLKQGRNTLALGKGICTDCAAAAAVRFL